jgi:hypothetical protein
MDVPSLGISVLVPGVVSSRTESNLTTHTHCLVSRQALTHVASDFNAALRLGVPMIDLSMTHHHTMTMDSLMTSIHQQQALGVGENPSCKFSKAVVKGNYHLKLTWKARRPSIMALRRGVKEIRSSDSCSAMSIDAMYLEIYACEESERWTNKTTNSYRTADATPTFRTRVDVDTIVHFARDGRTESVECS